MAELKEGEAIERYEFNSVQCLIDSLQAVLKMNDTVEGVLLVQESNGGRRYLVVRKNYYSVDRTELGVMTG